MTSDSDPQVLIVGAGPTGLLTAIELARRDVPFLLVDAHDAPLGWDRATVVHARSLEVFEALGLVDRFLEQGVRTHSTRIHSDGALLGEVDLADSGSRYDFDLGLSEEVTEAILTEHLAALGGEVVRSTRVIGLHPEDDSATVTLERNGERRTVTVPWVVGCDGYHSTVREAVGISFPGHDIEREWAVFDVTIDGWRDGYDIAAVYLDDPPLILTALPERRWRAYVRPVNDASDPVGDAAATLRAYLPGARFDDVENPTRFRCHTRVASHYRAGPVLVAGDAAHVCTPAEGHGMNTGLHDAFNLGWKLALVCRGVCDPSLLDSYQSERRPVAEAVGRSGDRVEANQNVSEAEERRTRDTALRRALADPHKARRQAVNGAEQDMCYPDSPIVTGDANVDLGPGWFLPDTAAVQHADGSESTLPQLTYRAGHTVLVLGAAGTGDRVADLVRRLRDTYRGSEVIEAATGLVVDDDRPAGLGRVTQETHQALGLTEITMLAIRPDRFVGLRHDGTDAGTLDGYLSALGT